MPGEWWAVGTFFHAECRKGGKISGSGIFNFVVCSECAFTWRIGVFEQRADKQGDKDRVFFYGGGFGSEYAVFDRGRCAMVKFFGRKQKEEVFANGRIIATNFSKLKKEEFPQYENGDMFFLHYDGKIYIDITDEANETIISTLKILVQYPKAELRKFEREQKRRYPDIKTAEDLEKLKGDNEGFMKALSMFLIPMEIKSRELQKAYYGII